MAEVETHSNGKHALEDIDAPIKSKLFKGENGQSKHANGNGVKEPVDIEENEENSTSAATAGGDSSSNLAKGGEQSNNSTSINKYEFSESEGGEESNTNGDLGTNGDDSSRVCGVEENTSESTNGLSNGKVFQGKNNLGDNSADNYGDEEDEEEEDDGEVGVEGEEEEDDLADEDDVGEDDEEDCGDDDDDDDDDDDEDEDDDEAGDE